MMFNNEEYEQIHDIVFSDDYPGYRPNIIESPNGNDVWDTEKRYAHIAQKHLEKYDNVENRIILQGYLDRAYGLSLKVARELKIPIKHLPSYMYGAMRVLDYPPGAVTNPHKDFDLFTLMMYRDDPSKFKYLTDAPAADIRDINHQVHYGELLEEIGLAEAHMHEVIASEKRQRSIVYFAIPDWTAELKSGLSVGEWLQERLSRSRKEVVG